MEQHIRESNLIEGIDSPEEDQRSLRAWKWLIKQPYIDLPILLELHRKITLKQLKPFACGKLRTVQVYVGKHVPPPPDDVVRLTLSFLQDFQNNWQLLHPKDTHVRFETIHPFVDGNGRTGRMLMWWHEIKRGGEPTLLLADERQYYYQWFREKPIATTGGGFEQNIPLHLKALKSLRWKTQCTIDNLYRSDHDCNCEYCEIAEDYEPDEEAMTNINNLRDELIQIEHLERAVREHARLHNIKLEVTT